LDVLMDSWQALLDELRYRVSTMAGEDDGSDTDDCGTWIDPAMRLEFDEIGWYKGAVQDLDSVRRPAVTEMVNMLEAAGARPGKPFDFEELMPERPFEGPLLFGGRVQAR